MEFTKHCENKEIVAECIASVFEPVEEGWGRALAVGLALGLSIPTMGISLIAGQAAIDIIDSVFDEKLGKALKNPVIKKYIINECKKAFTEVKKSNKSATTKLPSGWARQTLSYFKEVGDNVPWYYNIIYGRKYREFSVGDYLVCFFGDTKKVAGCFVVFWDEDENYSIARKIAVPSMKDLDEAADKK